MRLTTERKWITCYLAGFTRQTDTPQVGTFTAYTNNLFRGPPEPCSFGASLSGFDQEGRKPLCLPVARQTRVSEDPQFHGTMDCHVETTFMEPVMGHVVVSQISRQNQVVQDLFEQYSERLFCFARKFLPPNQSEDIVQEVFTRLMQVEELDTRTISIGYLIKMADNLIKRKYRRAQRFCRYMQEEGARRAAEAPRPVSHDSVASGHRAWSPDLAEALASLPLREQQALRFIICEGMSYEATARTMGVPISTLNNWKFRGLQKLRDYALSEARSGCAESPARVAPALTLRPTG